MDIEELNFLKSREGRKLLDQYKDYSEADLHRLLLKNSKENLPHFPSVVSLIKLRKKAEGKFSKSQEMFFTSYGLEQSTDEKISKIISERFKKDWKVVDLTCGIGGNLISLAKSSKKVVAVDMDSVNLECARENVAVYGVNNKIEFILGSAFDNIPKDADAFFIDPSRMREGKTKTRSLLNSEPNILEMTDLIFKETNNLCVKISPAFDYGEIKLLPEIPEIEIISDNNVCKVALLWFGEFKTCERRATCIVGNKIYSLTDSTDVQKAEISAKPLNYIYEPNKAISKAHLVNELAERYGLYRISPKVSFLTSDELIAGEEKSLFRIFKVTHQDKFSLKKLEGALRDKNIDRVNIIIKKFPLKPEELYKKIKIKEGGDVFIIIAPLKDDAHYFILAERVSVN